MKKKGDLSWQIVVWVLVIAAILIVIGIAISSGEMLDQLLGRLP